MGVKSVANIDCVKLPEIVVTQADRSVTPAKRQSKPFPSPDGNLRSVWDISKSSDWPGHKKSNQSSSLQHSVEGDLHLNSAEESPAFESSRMNPRRIKRRHSERYQSHAMKSRGSRESPSTNGICHSESFSPRKQVEHLRPIQGKVVFQVTQSDTFQLKDLVNYKTIERENWRRPVKLGDTKALIEKYTNPFSEEELLASYQSDLSFLSKNRATESRAGSKRHLLWNKTKDKTPEELNMLDLGNSNIKKKKSMSEKSKGGVFFQERHAPSTPRRASIDIAEVQGKQTPVISPSKRVFFSEDSTKIMDIVEIEPTLEFAERVGRRNSELAGSVSVQSRDSRSTTPVSRSLELKPILKNTGIPQTPNSLSSFQQADTSSIGFSEYYQDSSDSDSDSECTFTPLRRPVKVPTWPTSQSMVVPSRPYLSPRFGNSWSSEALSIRSRTLSEIPISRSNSTKKVQCSKEFARVMKNLDSDNEVDCVQ